MHEVVRKLFWRAPEANRKSARLVVFAGALLALSSRVRQLYPGILAHAVWTAVVSGPVLLLLRDSVLTLLLMPSQYISVLQARANAEAKRAFLRETDGVSEEVLLRGGGESLDAVAVYPTRFRRRFGEAGGGAARWIVWVNANGMCFEELLPFTRTMAEDLGAVVLAFNNRGVSQSTGRIRTGRDLVDDTKAAILHVVREKGVPPDHVIVHGHSMGAAAGTIAVAELGYAGMGVVNDRSFADLPTVVRHVLAAERPFGGMLCGLFGGAVAIVSWLVAAAGEGWPVCSSLLAINLTGLWCMAVAGQRSSKMAVMYSVPATALWWFGGGLGDHWLLTFLWGACGLLERMAFGGVGGWMLGRRTTVGAALLSRMVPLLGWRLDAMSAFGRVKGPKLIIYHKKDMIVPHATSMAHRASGEDSTFELTLEPPGVAHMYGLSRSSVEWSKLVDVYRQLL
eukprot:TRINITY_DN30881_c0_g1_i1.p1 TRINITY_DN30881_c0_g1~~TRINITY_DN30881_c0_g1_i1.p1  ORF type:complete len:453 (+),score=109.25 TRINITY_DN30881_c0_g1_i1:96-1454(+)